MTDKLTWAEFADKYKPKDGDKFLDDRGNEWSFEGSAFTCRSRGAWMSLSEGSAGDLLTCPLIPPKAKKKLWPAISFIEGHYRVSSSIYESEEDAKAHWPTIFVLWPAIPNADGSYTVPE